MTLHNHLFLNTIPLPPHHPYTHPELPKQSVAKSETFGSKSLACQSLAPYRTYSHQFARSQNNLSQNRRHLAQNLSHAAAFFPPLRGKKMDEVWGILAVFTRMQREKEGER